MDEIQSLMHGFNVALSPTNIARLDLAFKPSKGLKKFGATGDFEAAGFPALTRALELAERFPEHFESKPGPEWLKDFFDAALKDKGRKPDRSESVAEHA